MDIREKLDIPLIIHIIRRTGYGWKLEGGDDFIHDVYVECLSKEKHYNPEHAIGTFIKLQVRNLIAKQYVTLKGQEKMSAEFEEFFEEGMGGVSDNVEEKILLEELDKHLCIEMRYYLKDPSTPDFAFGRNAMHCLGKATPYMTYERIGEELGYSKMRVYKRIKRNRNLLRRLCGEGI